MRTTGAVAAVLTLALLGTGCTKGGSDAVSASPGPPASPGAPGAIAAKDVKWTDCADKAASLLGNAPATVKYSCATIEVPEDWNTPGDGRTYDIALLRARSAKQTDRIGSLIINPGGPGGSGVDYAVYMSALPITSRFDIVGFDPRGVGRSTQVKCMSDKELDASVGVDPDPASQASYDAIVTLNRRIGDECKRKYGESLSLFSTVQAAHDIDAIRTAVGDEKTTYLGFSYGTLLGAVYAELFPTKVRAMVLDGAIDPQLSWAARSENQAKGFERALSNFATWCKDTPGQCPIAPNAKAAINAALNASRLHPVKGADGRTARPGWVFMAVLAAMYVKGWWPRLARAITDLDKGDPKGIFALADGYLERDAKGHYTNLFDANAAVNCADYDDMPTVEDIRKLQGQWRGRYPFFGTALATGMIGCAVWPAKADPFPVGPAKGAPPIVVIGTTGDPATPVEQAPALAKMLGTGRTIIWNGEGHTAYPQTTCVQRAVDTYLTDLTPPADGLQCPPS
jgi:pimeloyl-ACP methyl ester carboxylesterase